jgi:rhodanese-related sulfurtransferase
MKTITRDELTTKIDGGEQLVLVEVLDRDQFEKFHLPGAINVPVAGDFDHFIQKAVPDRNQPVVVYCANASCNASPKAAERMDRLGYMEVYDYEAGKQDWKEAGLPVET